MNEQNTPSTPTDQDSVTTPTPQSNLTWLWILIAVLVTFMITALVIGIGVFYWFSHQVDFMHAEDRMEEMMDDMHDEMEELDRHHDDDRDESSDDEDEDITDGPIAPTSGTAITSVDSDWNRYTNYDVGFSIEIPQQFYHYYGAMCDWDGTSYRPAGDFVDSAVFTGTDEMYISSANFYNMSGETVVDGVTNYANCDLVANSLAALQANTYWQQQSWRFEWRNGINNDADLESFLQDRYGSGCSLGSKDPAAQPGTFDVKIEGDGLDLGSTLCPINYATVVRYSPSDHLVVAWDLGQAITFPADSTWMTVYDQDMVDSFRFE